MNIRQYSIKFVKTYIQILICTIKRFKIMKTLNYLQEFNLLDSTLTGNDVMRIMQVLDKRVVEKVWETLKKRCKKCSARLRRIKEIYNLQHEVRYDLMAKNNYVKFCYVVSTSL